MKLGQVVKNTLDELSKSSWQKTKIFGEERPTLETTVDPKYSQAVEILIRAGLGTLREHNAQYKYVSFFLHNDIFAQFVFYDEKNQSNPVPKDFLKALEIEINNYVKSLALNWVKSNISINEIIIPEDYVKNYGDDVVILEHPSLGNSDVLLRILAKQYDYYPEVLDITDRIKNENEPRKIFIIGKENFVAKFINTISADIAPCHYDPEIKDNKPAEIKLQDRCIKAISRYSLFYPYVFSLDVLPNYGIPEELLKQIEETPMEHVQKWEDMDKYKGKIIIFKTTSYYLGSKKGYLIHPGREELKVGMVANHPSDWQGGEKGYNLNMLLLPIEIGGNRALLTSKLKYSDFKVRLPLPSELDQIKEAVQKNEGEFEYSFDKDKIIKTIETQKIESEQMLSTKLKKLSL